MPLYVCREKSILHLGRVHGFKLTAQSQLRNLLYLMIHNLVTCCVGGNVSVDEKVACGLCSLKKKWGECVIKMEKTDKVQECK